MTDRMDRRRRMVSRRRRDQFCERISQPCALTRLCSRLEGLKDIQADHSDHHSAAEQAVFSQFYHTSNPTSLSYFLRFFLLPSAARLQIPARSQGPVRVHSQRGCRDPLLHELMSAYINSARWCKVQSSYMICMRKTGLREKRRRLKLRDAGDVGSR
jgi:hypothetical protein